VYLDKASQIDLFGASRFLYVLGTADDIFDSGEVEGGVALGIANVPEDNRRVF
jgi:hypothetical protein